jgi:hypothetical protein
VSERALRERLAQAGYTPGRREVAPLVALLAEDEEVAPSVRRALGKADAAVVVAAVGA